MSQRTNSRPGAIGFRVKTARATAVLLAGPVRSPRVLERRAVDLWDPKLPESRQPYHAALELSDKDGTLVVRRASDAAKKVAICVVGQLAKELRERGHDLRAVGLVVGSDVDPDKLSNAHIRAHAAEGRLFRQVLEAGAAACGVPCLILVEREAYKKAAASLDRSPDDLKRAVATLGNAVGRPWTSEEKTATLAAWVALAR